MSGCAQCGGPLPQLGRGRPRTFCLGCRPRSEPLKAALAQECEWCGGRFDSIDTRKRFCRTKCQIAARDDRKRVPCSGCGALIQLGRGSRPAGEARCRSCWTGGCGTRGAYDRGCRCVDCRRAKAESIKSYLPPKFQHHWIAPADRVAIYERDGWACQLCGLPVDLAVHHLHRDAPTLDHIEPRSLALIPDDSPANLRTAHRGCNAARGNRIEVA